MSKTLLALAALAAAAPALSYANPVAKLEAAFKAADKDSDGTLDKTEAKAMPRVAKNFDAVDSDKDGTVSFEEVKAALIKAHATMHEKGEAAFKKADKDNDGTLTKEEAKAMRHVAKNFDAIDTDKDGTVSLEEVHTFMHAKHAAAAAKK
jgi:Ca2+-binding EF-hand superfamily protein